MNEKLTVYLNEQLGTNQEILRDLLPGCKTWFENFNVVPYSPTGNVKHMLEGYKKVLDQISSNLEVVNDYGDVEDTMFIHEIIVQILEVADEQGIVTLTGE